MQEKFSFWIFFQCPVSGKTLHFLTPILIPNLKNKNLKNLHQIPVSNTITVL